MPTCGTGNGNFPQPGDPSNDSVLSAVPVFGGIRVSWTYPGLNPEAVAHTLLYRSTSSVEGTQVQIRVVDGDFYVDLTPEDAVAPIEYFYWIRIRSVNATLGDFIGPVSATALPLLDNYIELLTGQITESALAESLTTKLNSIATVQTALDDEVNARIFEDSLIGQSINSLSTLVGDIGTQITEETNTRQTDHDALVQVVNTLSAGTGTSLATLETELKAYADTDSAAAIAVATLNAAVADPVSGLINAHARINTEETARADGDTALANSISVVQAEIADPATGLDATRAVADGKITTFYSASPPTAEAEGDLWFETDNGNLLHRWNGSAWVEARDGGVVNALSAAANAQTTADGKIVSFFQGSSTDGAPVGVSEGDVWFDTDNGNHPYRWADIDPSPVVENWQWVDAQDSGIAQAITAATDAQSTADGKVTTFYAGSLTDGAPTAEGDGDLWVDTEDQNRLYRWDAAGNAWVDIRDGKIQEAINLAAGSQAAIDGTITTFSQPTAPVSADPGDYWFDTDNNNAIYRWADTDPPNEVYAWVSSETSRLGLAFRQAFDAQDLADGKAVTFYTASAPTAEGIGDLWIDTSDENRMHRWDGSTWVDVRDARIAIVESIAEGKVQTFYATSAPTAESIGDLWIDTDNDNLLHRWDGASWVAAADGRISIALGNTKVYWSNTAPTIGNTPELKTDDIWFDTDDDDRPYRWNGTNWVATAIATNSYVGAQIIDNNTATVGYCEIGGNPDTSHSTPAACEAAGGTWNIGAPLAQSVKRLDISTAAGVSSIEQKFQIQEDLLDGIQAEYTIKIQNGNYLAGFGLINDGTTSSMIFDVDNFSVGKLGVTEKFPFIVNGSDVFIDTAFIDELNVTKIVDTLGNTIWDTGTQTLKAEYIDASSIVAETVRSPGFTSGSTGFELDGSTGSAEFNNLRIYDPAGNLVFASGTNYLVAVDTQETLTLNEDPSFSSSENLLYHLDNYLIRAGSLVSNIYLGDSLDWENNDTEWNASGYVSLGDGSSSGEWLTVIAPATSVIPGEQLDVQASFIPRESGTGTCRLYVYYYNGTTAPHSPRFYIDGQTDVGELVITDDTTTLVATEVHAISDFGNTIDFGAIVTVPAGAKWASVHFVKENNSLGVDLLDLSVQVTRTVIGPTYIADAAITKAKIGIAEIDTLRIKTGAVTVPQFASFADGQNSNTTSYSTIGSFVFNHGHSEDVDVIFDASAAVLTRHTGSVGQFELRLRLEINGSYYYSPEITTTASGDIWTTLDDIRYLAVKVLVTLPPGDHTITFQGRGEDNTNSNDGIRWRGASVVAQAGKR